MRKKQIPLSVIIIGKNDESKIADALESAKDLIGSSGEIIYLDTGSTDKSLEIAQLFTSHTHIYTKGFFSDWRNKAKALSRGKWILYLDTDERITESLKKEIITLIKKETVECVAYAIPRDNYILGRLFKFGGEFPDYQIRFFLSSALEKWEGDVHEHPVFQGNLGYFKHTLTHLKHEKISEMVEKTNRWSAIEAQLMYNAKHPKMNILRFISAVVREAVDRFVKKKGYKDGREGIIYSFYQVFSRFVSYAKLWEMQIKKT